MVGVLNSFVVGPDLLSGVRVSSQGKCMWRNCCSGVQGVGDGLEAGSGIVAFKLIRYDQGATADRGFTDSRLAVARLLQLNAQLCLDHSRPC